MEERATKEDVKEWLFKNKNCFSLDNKLRIVGPKEVSVWVYCYVFGPFEPSSLLSSGRNENGETKSILGVEFGGGD